MRLNKFISHNTNYSRREADELIGQGKENQHRAISDSATSFDENDKVKVSGRFAKLKKEFTMITQRQLVGKKDDRGRRTIYGNLPHGFSFFAERLFPRLLHADNLIQRV